jgi:hypothetical protein
MYSLSPLFASVSTVGNSHPSLSLSRKDNIFYPPAFHPACESNDDKKAFSFIHFNILWEQGKGQLSLTNDLSKLKSDIIKVRSFYNHHFFGLCDCKQIYVETRQDSGKCRQRTEMNVYFFSFLCTESFISSPIYSIISLLKL